MSAFSQRISDFKESIFATMAALAQEHKAANLSQGSPDFDGPEWLKEMAEKSFKSGNNQYAPSPGTLNLRKALQKVYQELYGLTFDWVSEITITNGATEAIFSTIMALVNPGDEVIVLEPFYDSYVASIKMAGGIPVPVTLKRPHFRLSEEELEEAFTTKTKLLILNSPHNPTGHVFSRLELESVARLVKKYKVFVLSDEVYEHLTFDGHKHIPFASLPDMRDQTITISSAGKTFGMTGWKIGWALAGVQVSRAIRLVHQFNTFSVATPLQEAVALGLQNLSSHLKEFQKLYLAKRDFLFNGLQKLGWRPYLPEGTYFILAPIDHLLQKDQHGDVDFCMDLIKKQKVATIPPSAFYLKSQEGKSLVRLCFAKTDETLKRAMENLSSHGPVK